MINPSPSPSPAADLIKIEGDPKVFVIGFLILFVVVLVLAALTKREDHGDTGGYTNRG